MTTATHEEKPLLTVGEICSRLKVSVSTVRRLVDSRALPFLKIRGGLRFRTEDIEAFLEAQTVRPVVRKRNYGS